MLIMDAFPDPALIGQAFVRQYYTQMHKDPSEMHRFYIAHSSFVHGGSDIGSEEPVIGQSDIHEKIISLDLQQVHAKIKQVDAHSTLQNGIVVQVTGELSIKGHPMRAFVQTFVLAQQKEKSFYVHNDIFRYQDDDLVSESETNETPENPENTLHTEPTESCEFPPSVGASGDAGGVGSETYDGVTAEVGNSVIVTEEPPQEVGTGAWNQYDSLGEVAAVNGVDTPTQPPQEFPSATEPVEVRQDEETFPSAEVPEQDNKASTWASRLAQNQSSNRPLNSTAISTSQSLPQRDPRPRRTDNSRPQTQPLTSALKDKKPLMRDIPDSCQLFVGGLPANTTEAELRQLFDQFGPVGDIRVNPKNFAFIVFTNPKTVTDLMANHKNSLEIRGKQLNIEEKRSSRGGGRGGSGDRDRNRGGGFGGGPGGNKPRGGGGGGGGGKPPKR